MKDSQTKDDINHSKVVHNLVWSWQLPLLTWELHPMLLLSAAQEMKTQTNTTGRFLQMFTKLQVEAIAKGLSDE